MNFKTLTTAPLAALLLFGGQVQAKETEVITPATIGKGACAVARTGIPMTRAMQIAVGANKGTTISLAGVATSQEIVTMTWHAARQACPERFETGIKKDMAAVRAEKAQACSKLVSNAPRAERLKVMMSAC